MAKKDSLIKSHTIEPNGADGVPTKYKITFVTVADVQLVHFTSSSKLIDLLNTKSGKYLIEYDVKKENEDGTKRISKINFPKQ